MSLYRKQGWMLIIGGAGLILYAAGELTGLWKWVWSWLGSLG